MGGVNLELPIRTVLNVVLRILWFGFKCFSRTIDSVIRLMIWFHQTVWPRLIELWVMKCLGRIFIVPILSWLEHFLEIDRMRKCILTDFEEIKGMIQKAYMKSKQFDLDHLKEDLNVKEKKNKAALDFLMNLWDTVIEKFDFYSTLKISQLVCLSIILLFLSCVLRLSKEFILFFLLDYVIDHFMMPFNRLYPALWRLSTYQT